MKKASKVLSILTTVVLVVGLTGLECKTDTEPPVIQSITIEDSGNYRAYVDGDSIKGIVSVIVNASDNIGVKEVKFFVNQLENWEPVPGSDSVTQQEDEFTYHWQTTLLEDSLEYTICAVAIDEAGNVSDTSEKLTRLVRIPNLPPYPVCSDSMRPADDAVIDDSAAVVLLAWWGSDPDTLPPQELEYDVFFGKGSPNNMVKMDSGIAHKQDTLTTWSTIFTEEHLVPETDYYWMILSRDPYGQDTVSDTFKFTRPENKQPPAASSPDPPDTIAPIVYPSEGEISLSWNCQDPDHDSVSYRLYLADGPTWEDNPQLIAEDLKTASYRMELDGPGTYYWRPVPEDNWGATPDSTASSPQLWMFILE
ncbi:hypothetical protein GF359_00185 [candidate division WOR-3 bacterium]|uniref:Fibronectin type-III domain-containing protein n=1 Tax=candidate division WOR-3 bacterium TaxID=2052148 RepID=A0A9D5QC38_UNCW3|nr:hypothetical protein [candidate division WOR-3 bacterium]MBD3363611.1 hypothetical protein [candidate division WOR-3 bacterium]